MFDQRVYGVTFIMVGTHGPGVVFRKGCHAEELGIDCTTRIGTLDDLPYVSIPVLSEGVLRAGGIRVASYCPDNAARDGGSAIE